ncbi:hypothetical protein ALC57_14179 [Trachymyrmex cornetzi]|uniref:Mutator-like transposase domain-containing protein n=1 Tax=Trachymyrmex cornetzi TaxID=471704 RepID=A0A151IYQ5_9HYME|nr:hypothetical protein ALC57_14179 [Trachymyrmex cornetzi]
MKRSYKTGRYDSLSGVGTICGARTGKVLHISVRNKYCSICIKAEKLNKEPAIHKCYKNWGRDCSSTSMEADTIVGFYFYDGSQKENEENYIPQLKKCGLYEKLQNALKYLTWNAKSLLQNKDSNRVGTFKSVISKCIGGKRINFGLRGSYQTRCYAAVVTFNTGKPISCLSNILKTKPGKVAVEFENKKRHAQIAYGTKKRSVIRKVKYTTTDKDYSPQAEKPDAPPAEMELRKVEHMHILRD